MPTLPRRRSARAAVLAATVVALSTAVVPSSGAAAAATARPDLETATIQQLERLLDARQLTAVGLAELYLRRIDALNLKGPSLNAVRAVNPAWRAQARAIDAQRARGIDLGPMMGMPVLVKDNIDVRGMPTTAGSVALADNLPAADAPVVRELKEAGAVILGKTNMAEFAYYLTAGAPNGYSSLGGQVLNPYDLATNTGGSSSGAGSAMAAGLSAGNVGSDTGGSILQPSHTMSNIGVRPTVGLLSRSGVVPISSTNDTTGPMTHTVWDAAAMLTAMTTGIDPGDPQTATAGAYDTTDYTRGLSATALQGVRLGYVPTPPSSGTAPTSADLLYEASLQTLRDQGAVLVPVSITAADLPTRVWDYEFKKDLNAYLARTPATTRVRSLADVIAYNEAHAAVALKFGQTLLTASQAIDVSDPATVARYEQLRVAGLAEAQRRIDATLAGSSVEAIVFSGQSGNTTAARAAYPAVMARAGYQATNRQPFGLEFVGTAYSEAKLLAYAYDYELAANRWLPPSVVNPTLYRCTGLVAGLQGDCPTSPAAAPVLRISPATAVVRPGQTVRLSVRLLEADGSLVRGATVRLLTRARGASAYRTSRTLVTDANGLAAATFRPGDDFRWYATADGAVEARSAGGLVQVRQPAR